MPASHRQRSGRPRRRVVEDAARRGFTLLEIITVLFIIGILAVMALPVLSSLQRRAALAGCTQNLKNLHIAANLYLQEHNQWPQISVRSSSREQFATAWQDALQPYGIQPIHWVCPSIQKLSGNPDLNLPANRRVDYIASPFDSKPHSPFQWPTQPWFAENANMHGGGNLLIFPDGHVQGMKDFLASQAAASAPGK